MAGSLSALRGRQETASSMLFVLYIYFTLDFFLHFSMRVPAYGLLRPTFTLTIVIALMLIAQKDRFAGHGDAPAFKALLMLLLYVLISLPLVKWPGSVLRANVPEFVKAISFFFFAALIIDTEKRLRIFLLVFLSCQLIRVLEPLYLHITEGYWGSVTWQGWGEYYVGRLAGAPSDVINSNELGFVIATLVPYLYYLLWCSRRKLAKLLFAALFPAIMYALVLTMSRGAFIALLVVGWMIFRNARNRVPLVLVAVALAAALWSNMTPIQKDRYLSLFKSNTSQSATMDGRIEGIKQEFMVGLRRPIFGHGVGTALEAKYHAIGAAQPSHNLYAELLIEIGGVGFILFMGYLKALYQTFRANRESMNTLHHAGTQDFRGRLNLAMTAVFWMYAVYSINYWGLSVYYWYLFGGLTVAFSRIYFSEAAVAAAQPDAGSRSPVARRRKRGMQRGTGRLS